MGARVQFSHFWVYQRNFVMFLLHSYIHIYFYQPIAFRSAFISGLVVLWFGLVLGPFRINKIYMTMNGDETMSTCAACVAKISTLSLIPGKTKERFIIVWQPSNGINYRKKQHQQQQQNLIKRQNPFSSN